MADKEKPKGETSIQLIYSRLTHIEDWLECDLTNYIDLCTSIYNYQGGVFSFKRYKPDSITEHVIDSLTKRIDNLETETKNLRDELESLKDTVNTLDQEVYISE